MTRRRSVAGLALASLTLAWMVGSPAVAVAGIGLGLAAALAWLWSRLARRPPRLVRSLPPATLSEGDDLAYDVLVTRGPRIPVPGIWTLEDRLGSDRAISAAIRPGRRQRLVVRDVPRGRHALGPATIAVDDPLGLARAAVTLPIDGTVLVRPRVVELGALFTDGDGRFAGQRGAIERAAGVDLHGLREYRDGEPLRAVHWPSTARRGRLMVRELEEPTRHDLTIELDLDEAAGTGPSGRTSLDEAVRATASLVRAYVRRGRAVRLVVVGSDLVHQTVATESDWETALDLLAAAEPYGTRGRGGGAGVRSDRAPMLLVCARIETVASHARASRLGAVVVVDAPTYGGRAPSGPEPVLLRLAAAGTRVAVVRAGDDLAAVLGGRLAPAEVARG